MSLSFHTTNLLRHYVENALDVSVYIPASLRLYLREIVLAVSKERSSSERPCSNNNLS